MELLTLGLSGTLIQQTLKVRGMAVLPALPNGLRLSCNPRSSYGCVKSGAPARLQLQARVMQQPPAKASIEILWSCPIVGPESIEPWPRH